MKDIVLGIVAHVDAGKTTLSEGMLFTSGSIRKYGRVDNGDAFLDTYSLEKQRGITIFSKQAVFEVDQTRFTLLDTPGHVDFSAEMERTLGVLDYAILVISATDGVQGHTRTLWDLLQKYSIPTFVFVNKMDQIGADKKTIMQELKSKLSADFVDFTQDEECLKEAIAECDEELLERYFEGEDIQDLDVITLIAMCKMYPCYFGSALKMEGVDEFLKLLNKYTLDKKYPEEFGALVYKITRDEQNNRLSHIKITGGSLKVKDIVGDEKVNQIRIYSGDKYESVNEVYAGTICTVTGLNNTKAGMGLGEESDGEKPQLEPVLNYQIILPSDCNVSEMYTKLKQLEEEEPELQIVWNPQLKEIHAKLMGEIQIEILKELIRERFQTEVTFGQGNIEYRETIASPVRGMGHYEPLRHYAEVHLLMEPLPRGTGLVFDAMCSEDRLDRNWQRLVLTHLQEKEHVGVLTGSVITDMKITLVAGKAHLKHTEGGDFRQATYRAVRHGLKTADSILLEPYYDFTLELPSEMIGRALSDIDRMCGRFESPITDGEMSIITGTCPVHTMRDYHMEVISYTRGLGKLFCTFRGYEECHNSQDIINEINYDSETDLDNPTSSVFCAHGAGFVVKWDEVKDYVHLEVEETNEDYKEEEFILANFERMEAAKRYASGEKEERELEQIFARTYSGITDSLNLFHTNVSNESLRGKKTIARKTVTAGRNKPYVYKPKEKLQEYLLVDGYNIIFAWKEYKELAGVNIDSARDKLLDLLSNYQAIRNIKIIVVFDAYKLKGYTGETIKYNNIEVVFTKENQTADTCIEQMAHKMGRKYDVTVATSDRMERVTVLSQGCKLMSAIDLKVDIEYYNKQIDEKIKLTKKDKTTIFDNASLEVKKYIDSLEK